MLMFAQKGKNPVLQNNETINQPISDFDLGSIPPDLADLLNQIDWNKVDKDKVDLIKGYFEKFKHIIPLKKE